MIFPIVGAMSEFVVEEGGHWKVLKPKHFKPSEMVARAVAQFRSVDSDPMQMGRSPGVYDALRIYPRTIVEVMLAIDAQAYSFEAGNVRHEHEWKVWQDVTLPDGKLILPGVVSHATNVVEHPELVAERILRFANLVGRERVIASTDCGLGGRIHPDIAWAKLDALAQGAALASRQLWGRRP